MNIEQTSENNFTYRKLRIETSDLYRLRMADMHFFDKVRFNFFCVIMTTVLIVTNFIRPIYQRFN